MIRTTSERYFLELCHRVALFVYENELKPYDNQGFRFRIKTAFSNKLQFTYEVKFTNNLHNFMPMTKHSNYKNIKVTLY